MIPRQLFSFKVSSRVYFLQCATLSLCSELKKTLPACKPNSNGMTSNNNNHQQSRSVEFPPTTSKFAVGMARTRKQDFVNMVDIGVPVDLPSQGDEEVIVIYNKEKALPNHYEDNPTGHGMNSDGGNIPLLSMEDTVQHCDYLNVILTDRSGSRNQCVALIPQYESYHVQKWMRMEPKELGGDGKLDSSRPLHQVSRGYQSNGVEQFAPPAKKHIRQNWELLEKYFHEFDNALANLKPLVEKIATPDKTVIVMVCNFGQSELLVNFVCAAKSRQLDISPILVFATDKETKELAESLGLTAYYDEKVCDAGVFLTFALCTDVFDQFLNFLLLMSISAFVPVTSFRTLVICQAKQLKFTEIENSHS